MKVMPLAMANVDCRHHRDENFGKKNWKKFVYVDIAVCTGLASQTKTEL